MNSNFLQNLPTGLSLAPMARIVYANENYTAVWTSMYQSREELGGVRPGPVVRQSVMEKTGGNFSGIYGQLDPILGFKKRCLGFSCKDFWFRARQILQAIP